MADNLRLDGRSNLDIRPISLYLSPVPTADGSIRVTMGDTVVEAAAVGPLEPSNDTYGKCDVRCEISFIGSASRRSTWLSGHADWLEGVLRSIIDHNGVHGEVVVSLTVISDGGSAFSAAILATSCSLVLAGLPCTGPLFGVTAGAITAQNIANKTEGSGDALDRAQSDLVLDFVLAEEEQEASSQIQLAVNEFGVVGSFVCKQITNSETLGKLLALVEESDQIKAALASVRTTLRNAI